MNKFGNIFLIAIIICDDFFIKLPVLSLMLQQFQIGLLKFSHLLIQSRLKASRVALVTRGQVALTLALGNCQGVLVSLVVGGGFWAR